MPLDDVLNVILARRKPGQRIRLIVSGRVISGELVPVDTWLAGMTPLFGGLPKSKAIYLKDARDDETGMVMGWFMCDVLGVMGLGPE